MAAELIGLLDTRDNLWLGTGNNPLSFDNQETAEAARELVCERLEWPLSRVAVLRFEQAGKKRDEVPFRKSLDEAIDSLTLRQTAAATGISVERLQKIESGRVIQTRDEDNRLRQYLNLQEARAFKRMAANMARMIDWPDDFERAGGAVICEKCGLPYRDHPEEDGLTLTCDGRLWKL
jgi:hypothetical protein